MARTEERLRSSGARRRPPAPVRQRAGIATKTGGRPPGRSRRPPRRANVGYVLLLGLVLLVNLVGLVMVLSASSVQAQHTFGNPWYVFERQVLWLAIGSGALIVFVNIDYRRLRRLSIPLMMVVFLLLLAVLAPGVGLSANGSSRWLGVGSWRLQPSELAKLALVLFGADLLTRRADRMHDLWSTFVPVLAAVFGLGLLIMAQPDMGTTMIVFAIAFALLFVAGTPLGTLVKSFFAGGLLAFIAGMVQPYRRNRLLSFLHPFKDAGNTGYQVVQSYVGLGTGGIFGRGLGNGIEKWGFLPNPYTDFIFAVIGEETGLVGTVVVVLLFAGLAVLGVRAAVRAPDRFGTLLATGITAWIVAQALLNMGAVIGILPVTGVPLPFVSFGGSSLVITLGATGILANVARNGR
jgi:cell division protein FtsW